MKGKNTINHDSADKVEKAIARFLDQTIARFEGEADAFTGTLRLPPQFSSNQLTANEIYSRTQGDFAKFVLRRTGAAPHYLCVRADTGEGEAPFYRFALVTQPQAVDDPAAYADKASQICCGKAGDAGWGRGALDIVEVFKTQPKMHLAPQPMRLNRDTRDEVSDRLREHLLADGLLTPEHRARTLFASPHGKQR